MISINASIIAVHTRSDNSEALAFEAVADQIKTISEESIDRIKGLRDVLKELKELSTTINIAGRQRMLSQKIMKLYLIGRDHPERQSTTAELVEQINLFTSSLTTLQASPLNNDRIQDQLQTVRAAWIEFQGALEANDLPAAIEANNCLLAEANKTVTLYEELAGR